MVRLKKQDFLTLLVFLGLVLYFFNQIIFFQKSFCFRDISRYFYPCKLYAAEVFKGHLPLWNPYIFCGAPFLANLQSAVFYPLNLICCFPGFPWGFNFFFVFHYILAGIFVYLLCRRWEMSGISALFSCIAFTFGGYLVSVVDMSSTLCSVVWLPLILLSFDVSIDSSGRKRTLYTVLAGLFMSMEFLGGEPGIVFMTGVLLVAYFFLKAGEISRNEKCYPWFILPLVFLVLAGITAFQWIPFYEFLRLSDRSAGSYEALSVWSIPPSNFLSLLFPAYAGDITFQQASWFDRSQMWLKSFYPGILTLVFAGLAFCWRQKARLKWFMLVAAVVSALLSMGRYFPLHRLCSWIPGFGLIRYPARFMFLFSFCIALLAGFGLEGVLRFLETRRHRYSCWLGGLSCLVLVLDLFATGKPLNLLVDNSSYTSQVENIKVVQNNGLDRILTLYSSDEVNYIHGKTFQEAFCNARKALYPDTLMPYRIYDADGYESLELYRHREFLGFMKRHPELRKIRYLDMMNVRNLVSFQELFSPFLEKVRDDYVKIYRRKNFLPRAYLVYAFEEAVSPEDALSRIKSDAFNPVKKVVIESKPDNLPSLQMAESASDQASVESYAPEKVVINACAKTGAVLVLSDTFYPGWKAAIDGKQAEIRQANYLFRAVFLPPGTHKIEFKFKPGSFITGCIISFLCVAVIAGFWIINRGHKT